MEILSFIVSLTGATMLLLFAVRLVRTGIERAHGAALQRMLQRQTNLAGAAATGLSFAIIMQSSAAVALLAAGFLASGYLMFPTALAIVLGGDLGSALIVQVLTFPIGWLVSPLLAVGGWLAVKSDKRQLRQYGRIIMGIALILISLGLLRAAVEPVRDSAFLPAIATYLTNDLLTGFIAGAALAFIMHSGVASILVTVTLVQIGALPFDAGFAIMLGANLGSGIIPVWLTRGMDVEARRLTCSNLVLRGALAAIALLFAIYAPLLTMVDFPVVGSGQSLIFCHIGFNVLLLVISLPFCRMIEPMIGRMFSAVPEAPGLASLIEPGSHLDPKTLDSPNLALTSLKQELLRMSAMVEAMFRPALDMYLADDKEMRVSVKEMDVQVNDSLAAIRKFVASIPKKNYSKAEARSARDMVEYAIRLESAGDIIAKRLTGLARTLHADHLQFSRAGRKELVEMHEGVLANFKLAANVLISDDPESARLLNLEKTEVKRAERTSRKRHLKRLQKGTAESFETSDIHLETLRALREVNSHVSAIAYPVLYETGQLLETRLIQDMPMDPVSNSN